MFWNATQNDIDVILFCLKSAQSFQGKTNLFVLEQFYDRWCLWTIFRVYCPCDSPCSTLPQAKNDRKAIRRLV